MRKKVIYLALFMFFLLVLQTTYYNHDLFSSFFKQEEKVINLNEGNLKGLTQKNDEYTSQESDSWIEYPNVKHYVKQIALTVDYQSTDGTLQVYYAKDASIDYNEENSVSSIINKDKKTYNFKINSYVENIRVDFTNLQNQSFKINTIEINPVPTFSLPFKKILLQNLLITLSFSLLYFMFKNTEKFIRYRYWIMGIAFLLMVLLKLHGSSIGMWNEYIGGGQNDSKIIGESRGIRSDEWLVQTPYMFSQVENAGFLNYDNPSIRSEGQNMVIANVPTYTIETFGKVFYWGFLLFGKEYGISWFYFSKLILIWLMSFEIVMYITRNNKWLSLLGAFWIAGSAPIQWWFTTGAGVVELIIYAQAIIVSFIYFCKANTTKLRVVFMSLAALSILGFVFTLYPAVQVPIGFLVILFIIVIIWDEGVHCLKFNKVEAWSFIILVIIIIMAIGLFIWNSKDDLKLTLGTVYPGKRNVLGGGMNIADLQIYLINWLMPFRDTTYLNNSEASAFVNFIPLVVLGFIYMIKQKIQNKKMILILGGYLLVQLSFLFVGFPEILAKITLFSNVQEMRLAGITFGLIGIYISLWFINEVIRLKPFNSIQIITSCFIIFLVYSYSLRNTPMGEYLGDFKFLTIGFFILINYAILKGWKKVIIICISALTITGFIVNPISQGVGDVFDKPIAQQIISIKKQDQNAKWMTLDNRLTGQYLIALGVKSFNSVQFYPDMKMWKTLDDSGKYTDIYNRYAHISVHLTNDPTSFTLEQTDAFTVNLSINDLSKTGVKYVLSPQPLTDFSSFEKIYYEGASNLYIYRVK